jgi:HEAT repeat protein
VSPHGEFPVTPARALDFTREAPPWADAVAQWCRLAERWLHLSRRMSRDASETRELRELLSLQLPDLVARHGDISLEVTPRALVLGETPVLIAQHANDKGGAGGLEHELSWQLHRDGIRRLHFRSGLTAEATRAFLDAVTTAAPASATHEDLVTMLWDADPAGIEWETEEAEGTAYAPPAAGREEPPRALECDWPLPEAPGTDPNVLWREIERDEAAHTAAFAARWRDEHERPFTERTEAFVAELRARDPRPGLSGLLVGSLVTWLAGATQRGDWSEAREALALIERVDPERCHAGHALEHALAGLDAPLVIDRLDSDPHPLQAQAFALAVRIGAPALPLLVAILGQSSRTRVRAGAATALAFAFADDPAPLGALLADARWQVVRDTVFVLGQIGGPAVVPLLARAGRHVDARVRRAAVEALGQVPASQARPVLLAQLDAQDARALRSALAMLARDPDASTAEAVIARVLSPAFATRAEEHRLALITALPDLAGEAAVPALTLCLHEGGWFARPSAERNAAAVALQQLHTPAARTVLEQGRRHRASAVREACERAVQGGSGA